MQDKNVEINWATVELKWYGPLPSVANVEQIIKDDCATNLKGLEKVSELIFHTVFLSDTHDIDNVFCWGAENDECLHCEYIPLPKWVAMNEIELFDDVKPDDF